MTARRRLRPGPLCDPTVNSANENEAFGPASIRRSTIEVISRSSEPNCHVADCRSYRVPHRIYSSCVYPIKPPNGSTIIIYGHEHGLRLIWRGGKPFRFAESRESPGNVNGTGKDEPTIIDLEDDGPVASKPKIQEADFEDEDEEIDPTQPCQSILRHVDISTGTAVMHIGIPHVPSNASRAPPSAYPPILSSHIIIAGACSDYSIRVITVPLTPPPPTSKDPSAWGTQTVKITGSNTHQDLPSSVTITHTSMTKDSDEEEIENNSRSHSRNRIASPSCTDPPTSQRCWAFLVASISPTAGGLLLVHQIPIVSDKGLSTDAENLFPLQRRYLRCPISNGTVAFNPSSYPAERHRNILISSPDVPCVKLYQVFGDTFPLYSQGRRGSNATNDSIHSNTRSIRTPGNQGKFLIALYPVFSEVSETVTFPKRKRVLSAAWVLGGLAIIALLEDGEWGVWDVEAAGPSTSSSSQNLVQGRANLSGVQGGALTRFSAGGRISSAALVRPTIYRAGVDDANSDQLVPMTPHTRKIRSAGLFGTNASKPSVEVNSAKQELGSVRVTEYGASTTSSSSNATEESIIIVYSKSIVYIPALVPLWRAGAIGNSSTGLFAAIRSYPVSSPELGGQPLRDIAELPGDQGTRADGLFGIKKSSRPDLLISTSHSLVMLVSPVREVPMNEERKPQGVFSAGRHGLSEEDDQLLLNQGDLDVDGMVRILDSMTEDHESASTVTRPKIDFDLDGDGDVGMGKAAPRVSTRFVQKRGTPEKPRNRGEDRLFS